MNIDLLFVTRIRHFVLPRKFTGEARTRRDMFFLSASKASGFEVQRELANGKENRLGFFQVNICLSLFVKVKTMKEYLLKRYFQD